MADIFQILFFFFLLFVFAFPTLKKAYDTFMEGIKKNREDPNGLKREYQDKVEAFKTFLDTLDEEEEEKEESVPPPPPPSKKEEVEPPLPPPAATKPYSYVASPPSSEGKRDLKQMILMYEILQKPLSLRGKGRK